MEKEAIQRTIKRLEDIYNKTVRYSNEESKKILEFKTYLKNYESKPEYTQLAIDFKEAIEFSKNTCEQLHVEILDIEKEIEVLKNYLQDN